MDVFHLLDVLWRYDLLFQLIKTIGFVVITLYVIASLKGQKYYAKILAFCPTLAELGRVYIDIERFIEQEPVLNDLLILYSVMIVLVNFALFFYLVYLADEKIQPTEKESFYIYMLIIWGALGLPVTGRYLLQSYFPTEPLPPLLSLNLWEIIYKISSVVSWIVFTLFIIYYKRWEIIDSIHRVPILGRLFNPKKSTEPLKKQPLIRTEKVTERVRPIKKAPPIVQIVGSKRHLAMQDALITARNKVSLVIEELTSMKKYAFVDSFQDDLNLSYKNINKILKKL